jgi:hypothetical protein
MIVDFDGDVTGRRLHFESHGPIELQPRVFVIGPLDTPESLRQLLGEPYEDIGRSLADESIPVGPSLRLAWFGSEPPCPDHQLACQRLRTAVQ